jgi:hypothetical protein
MLKKTVGLAITICIISACEKKASSGVTDQQNKVDTTTKDPSTRKKNEDADHPSATGSLSINDSVANDLGKTNANLVVVQENLAPPTVGALAVGTGSAPLQLISAQTRGAEIHDRIKGTIEGTMRALGWIHDTINSVEPQLREEKNKTAGTINLGFMTIEYKFENEHKYKFLTRGGEGGDVHLSVDGNHYVLKRQPSKTDNIHPGINFVDVTYIDEDNWTLKDDNTSDICVNRPKSITTYVERKKGIWAGKMMYWGGRTGDVCVAAPAENAVDFTYFEFIGDDKATTAAGYELIPIGLADFTTLAQYGFLDGPSTAVNPVCLGAQDQVTPATACSSTNIDISTPNYGLGAQWILPADLAKTFNVFPEAI